MSGLFRVQPSGRPLLGTALLLTEFFPKMASIEELALAFDIIRYLKSCQRDLRREAQWCLDRIAASPRTHTTAQIAAVALGDAQNISRLLANVATAIQSAGAQTKANNGLTALSSTLAAANTARTVLKNAADTWAASDMSTDAAITAGANAVLASVPGIDFVD
jgi:hypothetical protein